MNAAPFPINTNHHNAVISGRDQRVQQRFHALVEEALSLNCAFLLINVFELRDREVAKQDPHPLHDRVRTVV